MNGKLNALSIAEIIKNLRNQNLVLPIIQREFVWERKQIEYLFESLINDYPIGTLLLWKTSSKDLNFFACPDHYTKGEPPKMIGTTWKSVNAVIDGQQRLTSIFIATQGSYKEKRTEYALYADLSNNPDKKKIFQFHSINKDISNTHLYKIQDIYKAHNYTDLKNEIRKTFKSFDETLLQRLHKLLTDDTKKILPVISIPKEKNQDDVLEIFVRVNRGGKKLTKTELLLSNIVPKWKESKKEFRELEDYAKQKNIEITQDLIMKTALACTKNNVVFKLDTFIEDGTISEIKTAWKKTIKKAFKRTIDLLSESGFCKSNILANNVIIPIAYYYHCKNRVISTETKEEMKTFIRISQLKSIFGGHSDQTLNKMIKILKSEGNSFGDIMKDKEFREKFKIDINKLLETEYKDPYAYLLLSIIYDDLDYSRKNFDKDHMHPKSKFSQITFKNLNIDNLKLEDWKCKKEQLPNLQLLTDTQNREYKRKKFLKEWLNEQKIDPKEFKKQNYISRKTSLDFHDFDIFFEDRKNNIKKILKRKLQFNN